MNKNAILLIVVAALGVTTYAMTRPPAPAVGVPPVTQATGSTLQDKTEDALLGWLFGSHGSDSNAGSGDVISLL